MIGILKGTGGITQIVEEAMQVSRQDTGVCVLYDDQHYRKPSCFCDVRADG